MSPVKGGEFETFKNVRMNMVYHMTKQKNKHPKNIRYKQNLVIFESRVRLMNVGLRQEFPSIGLRHPKLF